METVKNAVPLKFKAYHITPGIADYSDTGLGRVLVQKPALDKMQSSFIGKPVVNLKHTEKDPDELFQSLKNGAPAEEFADGVVSAVGYDDVTGWYWADMLIWDEETLANIENGYSVSCAYDVTEVDENPGTYNNVDYSQEVLDGAYAHMAIVPNPRYERAYIIRNSKGEEMTIRLFKSKEKKPEKKTVKNQLPDPQAEKEEEVLENVDGAVDIDGEQVPLAELIKAYQAEQGGGASMLNEDDEVDVGDGKRVRIGDMVNCYRNKKSAAPAVENAESPLDENAEKIVDEAKQRQNAAPKSEKPSESFKRVKNAASQESVKQIINTASTRLERGKQRYGTPVAQGGNK